MQYKVENLLKFADPLHWKCSVFEIGNNRVILSVLPNPPRRSRLHIEIQEVIYYDIYLGWNGCLVNIAHKKELLMYAEQLGTVLRQNLSENIVTDNYDLIVFPTSTRDNVFIAKEVVIKEILP